MCAFRGRSGRPRQSITYRKATVFGRIFGASAPKTGLSAPIFFAADGKKGFPLQSLAPHGLAMVFNLLTAGR
jgi:hypothetical protein